MKSTKSLQPDIKELVLCQSEHCSCETYVFEPAPNELALGHLVVAGEIENSDKQGSALLDKVIAAVQKEYYRNPSRSPLSSFESALRQANLILSETAESGQKNWMHYFNVAIAVIEKSNLHVSVAGHGHVLIGRNLMLSDVSVELAQFPITEPLSTFSQVASGNVMPGDTVWLTTSAVPRIFPEDALAQLSADHSAMNIAQKMQEMYRDQTNEDPIATTVVTILPNYVTTPKREPDPQPIKRQAAAISPEDIKPRKPLEIKKSNFKNLVMAVIGLLRTGWTTLWPLLKKGSVHGKNTLFSVSKKTHRGMSSMTNKHLQGKSFSVVKKLPSRIELSHAKSLPATLWTKLTSTLSSLPRTSKIFVVITIILAIALVTSLLLLQRKRTTDETIQRASEILHEAETKEDAADMALIYNNREQARIMLSDAEALLEDLATYDLYTERRQELTGEIQAHYDRLNKITRADTANATQIGDFGNVITQKNPTHLFWVNENIYTFNPENNAIVKMDMSGTVTTASSNTQGVGFFTTGVVHPADKTLILSSADGNLVIFDATKETVRNQEVELSSEEAEVKGLSVFGTRLYIYDKAASTILSLNKTLRGYSNTGPWITDDSFPKDNIKDIAVDGNIFTLHDDGAVRRLFKGAPAEFNAETVEPNLSQATRIVTAENMNHVYIIDPQNQRIVVYDKEGALVRQVMVDDNTAMTDAAIGPQEKKIYILNGTKVLEISLDE